MLAGCLSNWSHSDVFVTVLKEEQRPVSMATLQELALVTAVVSHAGYGNTANGTLMYMCVPKHANTAL